MVAANLGVTTCCPFNVNKPDTTCKPSNMILVFGATKHEQTTKHAFFCTQNERTTNYCGPCPVMPTDIKMAPPFWTALLSLCI